ncbi:MAG: glycoside hydrolase family 9 protein [Clostridia bacterium]|nr:glycoside hydrolase family 9 protein [Clostridia bacterium]
MERFLQDQLLKTGFVHFPLSADTSRSMEDRQLKKEVLERLSLWDGQEDIRWHFDGEGTHAFLPSRTLELNTPPTSPNWGAGENQQGHYASFGALTAHLDVSGLSLSQYNRLVFEIKPECDGLHSPNVRVGFVNDGVKKIPDAYTREGFHCMNLKNHVWNTCVWEFDTIPHDKITDIFFRIHKYGRELSGSDMLSYQIRNIEIQRIEKPDVKVGWQCAEDTIAYSTTGYFTGGRKTAVARAQGERFRVLNAETGAVAYEGIPLQVENAHGRFTVLDFSPLCTPGRYRLALGCAETEDFSISDTVIESAIWRFINFLFCERCGYPVPGKHGACHGDILAEHDGLTLVYNGGWHDAADVSQQTLQTAEVVHALLETAQAAKNSLSLRARLLEEALWGLDFVLRMKFPDGYRATSAGIRRWNDNYIGNRDDERARVFSNPFDHFVISGVEAYAATVLEDEDPELAFKCRHEACSDYRLALELFEANGMQLPYPAEHCYNASLSQYAAAACYSAAQLYRLTGREEFAGCCTRFADLLLACQDTGEASLPFCGFFYRDPDKRSIVHFNHQSREQIFAQALSAALEALPDHPHRARWKEALARYGAYLKAIASYAAPYGMIPAGVYALSETEDRETFRIMNLQVDFDKEKQNHIEQIQSGIKLGEGYYLKQFPVCFSYRGNTAIVLAMGKAAALAGRALGDDALLDIARDQLYWTLGKNPFGQSLIYGEGHNFGQQYTALLGETVGAIAVGVQTQGNEDLPYWPPANIATYREVWTSSAGRWLWVAAELLSN